MNKSKNKPAVMEYVIVGTLVVAAVAAGAWYYGRDVQALFNSACTAGGAVCGQSESAAAQCCYAAANDRCCATKFSSAWAQNKRFVDTCDSEGACFKASCAPNVNAFCSAPLRPETPGYERYAEFNENEFLEAAANPLSTFSIDVDTGSYTQTRRFLLENKRLPSRDLVRLEEFVNYFDYGYAGPTGKDPVAVHCAMGQCPWNGDHKLVRIGVQAKRLADGELPPNNLTFLIDVSGSMSSDNCLPLLVKGMKLLVDKMRDDDYVSIVTYASGVDVRLESTSGRNKRRIHAVLDSLTAGGCTSGGEGLRLAYEEAKRNFRKNGNNRVILASDGDWNVGITSESELKRFIESKRDDDIFLSVLGFGMGNYQDKLMKTLADAGNGHYAYIDGLLEAKKVLMTEFAGTLYTVAKDVKIQVEFNPAKVGGYRLLGYESRLLKAKDFNDDKKDAGEMGAGHTVTALYEIVPAGGKSDIPSTDALKYQRNVAAPSEEMLTVKLRYKEPDGDKSVKLEQAHTAAEMSEHAEDEDFRFVSAVAECALLLGDSKFKGEADWERLIKRAKKAKGTDENGYRAEFVRLAETAQLLK